MNKAYIGEKRRSEYLDGDQSVVVTVYVLRVVLAGVCDVIEFGEERQIYERFALGKVSQWTSCCCCAWRRRDSDSYAMKVGSGVH